MLLILKKVINVLKKCLIIFAVYFIVISLFFRLTDKNKAISKVDPIKANRKEIYKLISDQELNSSNRGKLLIAFYRVFLCATTGEACTNNPDDADKHFDSSLFGTISNLIVVPYANPPASGATWAYLKLQNTGFIPKSYAAEGIGFASIRGYIKIWSLFRDLAYLVLVIVLIAIGFMIMFRMKINPQTVISVENALPRIIIALIAITFSFAIAGLMIDIMYVAITVGIALLAQLNVGSLSMSNLANLENQYIGATLGDLWPYGAGWKTFPVGYAMYNLLPTILKGLLQSIFGFLIGIGVAWLVGKLAAQPLRPLEGLHLEGFTFGVGLGKLVPDTVAFIAELLVFIAISSFLPGLILGLIMLFTLLLLMFRIFFLLLTSYIKIILLIIFSPVILLLEAIPGKNVLGWWIKAIFGELLAFPLVVILMLVGYAVIQTHIADQVFVLPFIGGFSSQNAAFLIGLGIVLLIPDLIKLVREATGAKGLPLNIGLGTYLAGGGALLGVAGGAIGGLPSIVQRLPYGWQEAIKSIGYVKGKPGEPRTGIGGMIHTLLGPSGKELSELSGKNIADAINADRSGTQTTDKPKEGN
jgi:hypothetical protein